MKKMFLLIALATACQAYDDRPLHELVHTIDAYSADVATSKRLDHEIWCTLAAPVSKALTNEARNRPYDSPPPFSSGEIESLSLLTAYVKKQKSLDPRAAQAVEGIAALYATPHRADRYKGRSLSAEAIADRVNQSRIQREHVRRASPDERSIRRFEHEARVKEKQLRLQERALRNQELRHTLAKQKREQRRLQIENEERLKERKKIWRARKKAEYEAKIKAEMEQAERDRIRQEREERERIRKELLS